MLATGFGIGLGVYASWLEPHRLEIKRFDLWLHRWPADLDGLVVALVSDIHLGWPRGRPWTCPALEPAIEAVHRERPDVLVVCGDFGYKAWRPAALVQAAERFSAPQRVALLGNHDYALGEEKAEGLRQELEWSGYEVLVNEAITVDVRGRDVIFAGLAGPVSGLSDMPALARSVGSGGAPTILLTHTPDEAVMAPPGVFDLALAGHTHGGQIAIPGLERQILRQFARSRFDRGLYDIEGMPLIVTKGLGTTGYHARFRARPEVIFIRLHEEPPSKQR